MMGYAHYVGRLNFSPSRMIPKPAPPPGALLFSDGKPLQFSDGTYLEVTPA